MLAYGRLVNGGINLQMVAVVLFLRFPVAARRSLPIPTNVRDRTDVANSYSGH